MQRYLRYFLTPVVVIAVLAAILSAYFEPINGDLTRIGFFSERNFGWNTHQPAIHAHGNGTYVSNPDVLVLGDSFSAGNVWQSQVSDWTGHIPLTYTYDQISCPSSWLDYALTQPAKTVIVETVERVFTERYAKMTGCRKEVPLAHQLSPYKTETIRPTWPPALHISYTLRTALNAYRMLHTSGQFSSGKVINTPLKPGCAAFSNKRADRLIYYSDDNVKLHWSAKDMADAVANVKKIQDRFAAHGKKFIFIVVPDKSSVYRDCLAEDPDSAARKRVNPTQALLAAGVNTPDVMHAFQQNKDRIVDLYLPDNTHTSSKGYTLMAKQIEPLLPPAHNTHPAH